MNPSKPGGFGGFSFGAAPTLGTPAPSAAPATTTSSALFGFQTPAAASTAPAPSFGTGSFSNLGAASTATSFGAPAPTATSFGAPASTATSFGAPASTGTSFGAPASTAAFSFLTPSTTTSLPSAVPAVPAATLAAAPAPTFGGTSSSLSFGTPASKSSLPSFGAAPLQTNTSTAPISTVASTVNVSLTGPAIGFTSNTSTTPSTALTGNQMTFSQIEEMINKYTSELEEQEKVFINQATQVNSWDNLLNKNSKKIVELSNAVEKVKSEQKCLEDELKFIETQHTELEEFIAPLKKDVDKIPHSDLEKAQTYSLAENLDTQLRQMSEDLKEVIEHLNEVSKLQNSNDPIVQIGRILNAHMTSLQWIELSTSQINSKLEEINKMYDTLRRDTERNLRLTYCD